MPGRFHLPPLGGAPRTPDGWLALSMRAVERRIWPFPRSAVSVKNWLGMMGGSTRRKADDRETAVAEW